jgi:hypothetical protein
VFAGLYHLVPEVLDAVKTSSRRPSSDGIAPASVPGGAGNQDRAAVDQGHLVRFAN